MGGGKHVLVQDPVIFPGTSRRGRDESGVALAVQPSPDLLGKVIAAGMNQIRVLHGSRPQVQQGGIAAYPIDLAFRGDALAFPLAYQLVESGVGEKVVSPMVYGFVNRCLHRVRSIPDSEAAVAEATGCPVSEGKFDCIEPVGLLEGAVDYGDRRFVGVRLGGKFVPLGDFPVGRFVREVIEQILRDSDGFDVARQVLMNIREPGRDTRGPSASPKNPIP